MTSKYKFKIEINRCVNDLFLKGCLESLKDNQIILFPTLNTYCMGDISIKLEGCGYVKDKYKNIKLTNTQRREFIRLANMCLSGKRNELTIKGNEYINSLPLPENKI